MARKYLHKDVGEGPNGVRRIGDCQESKHAALVTWKCTSRVVMTQTAKGIAYFIETGRARNVFLHVIKLTNREARARNQADRAGANDTGTLRRPVAVRLGEQSWATLRISGRSMLNLYLWKRSDLCQHGRSLQSAHLMSLAACTPGHKCSVFGWMVCTGPNPP